MKKMKVCDLMDMFFIKPYVVIIKDDEVIYEGEYKDDINYCYKTIDSMFIDELEDVGTKGYLYIYLE